MVWATLWAVCDTAVASHPNKNTLCFLFCVFLATRHSLQNISSPNRDQTRPLAVEVQSPNHWTTREFPETCFLMTSDRNQSGWKIISLAGDHLASLWGGFPMDEVKPEETDNFLLYLHATFTIIVFKK